MKDYCKTLIDEVGRDGGFLINGGLGMPDESNFKNLEAFFEITREYGVY